MGSIYQNYADVMFESASHRLGRQVAAPRVLHAFDDEPESVPVYEAIARDSDPAADLEERLVVPVISHPASLIGAACAR